MCWKFFVWLSSQWGICGEILGAIVIVVVQVAKIAHRCQENCNKLAETLKHVQPIAMKLAQFLAYRSIECENWYNDIVKDLENAKEVVSCCKPCPWWKRFLYKDRVKLSKSLVSIDALINAKVHQAPLFQFNMIQEIYQRREMNDLTIVSQPTQKVIADFKGNVLQQLLAHILSKVMI